jgi:hypothetical protein
MTGIVSIHCFSIAAAKGNTIVYLSRDAPNAQQENIATGSRASVLGLNSKLLEMGSGHVRPVRVGYIRTNKVQLRVNGVMLDGTLCILDL